MIFVYDTETSGMVLHKQPPSHPKQPHLVQFAGVLCDDRGRVLRALSTLVKPYGKFKIEPQATKVHGITNEMAEDLGVPLEEALWWARGAWGAADIVVGHNLAFDLKVIGAALLRQGMPDFPWRELFCTMKMTTDLLRLPGKWGGKFKWPSLQELHEYFFGCGFSGAHDALGDVKATLLCYLELEEGKRAAEAVVRMVQLLADAEPPKAQLELGDA